MQYLINIGFVLLVFYAVFMLINIVKTEIKEIQKPSEEQEYIQETNNSIDIDQAFINRIKTMNKDKIQTKE